MGYYRYELKYIISKKQAYTLKTSLLSVMSVDSLANGGMGGYTISSLYFDDLDSTAYFEKQRKKNSLTNALSFMMDTLK